MSKPKNRVEDDDFAKQIDELHKAFPKPESTVVKEKTTLDSAGELNNSVVEKTTITVDGIMELAISKKTKGENVFSQKISQSSETYSRYARNLTKKKVCLLNFHPSKRKTN